MIAQITTTHAAEINDLHRQAERHLRDALTTAITCGHKLADVKQALPHGQFTAWLDDNCDFSARSARGYMRIAQNEKLLEAKRQSVATLGIGEALKLLSNPGQDQAFACRSMRTIEEHNHLLDQIIEDDITLSRIRSEWLAEESKLEQFFVDLGYDDETLAASLHKVLYTSVHARLNRMDRIGGRR